ncbi:Per1-domain-containing protein [Tilletiaria anomala UBC 951]|uniref:Per1-domain-containing protein n=1 Tax=Tilletiaria anomala (strain ATCC 24038 / CBS 436.72 / UBC 951) TaxID=1037660 RepID=A0A066VBW3_TILAU|nr:Per1-domain-containing protein [Tilletiaria anomala UBC 951]KDN39237.1 Per1-domain-containing protein [Tilletiaria anomala UBC 951]
MHVPAQLPTYDQKQWGRGRRRLQGSDDEDGDGDGQQAVHLCPSSPSSSSTFHLQHPSAKAPPRRNGGHRSSKGKAAAWLSAGCFCLAALVCCAAVPGALASEGDRSLEYISCVKSRFNDVCGPDGVDDGFTGRPEPEIHPDSTWLPWILRVTRWDCLDDTKYHCTHKVTNDAARHVQLLRQQVHDSVRLASGAQTVPSAVLRKREKELFDAELAKLPPVQKQMVQFYGKWVFVRLCGAQEPLSALASLLNLWVHAAALLKIRRQIPDVFPLKLVYISHALISINAWTWSAVFHTRDKPLTEKMDYFSAASVLLSALFFTACRLFRLAPCTRPFVTLLRAMAAAFTLHVLYLSFAHFDYGYNMTANVLVGLAHVTLWAVFSVRPAVFSGIDPRGDRFSSARSAMRASKPRSAIVSTAAANASSSAMSMHHHHVTATTTSSSSSHPGSDAHSHSHSPPAPVSSSLAAHRLATPESRRMLQMLLLGTVAATLLELLDFPPLWRFVDAHALWHLATVPLTYAWYDWLINDARACVGSGWWIGDGVEKVVTRVEPLLDKLRVLLATILRGRADAQYFERIDIGVVSSKFSELAERAGFASASRAGIRGEADASAEGGACAGAGAAGVAARLGLGEGG